MYELPLRLSTTNNRCCCYILPGSQGGLVMVPSALLAAQEGARGRPKCVSSILSFNLVLPLPGKIGSNLLDREQFEPYASTKQQFPSPRAFPLNSLIIPTLVPKKSTFFFADVMDGFGSSVLTRGNKEGPNSTATPSHCPEYPPHAKTDWTNKYLGTFPGTKP